MSSQDDSCYLIFACYQYTNGFVYEFGSSGILFSLLQVFKLLIFLVTVCSSCFCKNLDINVNYFFLKEDINVNYIYYLFSQQRGPEDVMNHLAREAFQGNVKSILFLTPCHATPYYSMLHQNVPMQFLDCTPRFRINDSGMTSNLSRN